MSAPVFGRRSRELWGIGRMAGAVKDRRCMVGMLNDRLRRRSTPNQDLFLVMVRVKGVIRTGHDV